jgi:hypothetical protein
VPHIDGFGSPNFSGLLFYPRVGHLEFPGGVDLKNANQVAGWAADAVDAGTLGYTLIIARRDSHTE